MLISLIMKIFFNIVLAIVIAFVINLCLVVFYQVPKQDYANSVTGSLSEQCVSELKSCFQKYPELEYEAKDRICSGFYEECFRNAQDSDPIKKHARNYFLIVGSVGLALIIVGIFISSMIYFGLGILIGGILTSISSLYAVINSSIGWNNYFNEYLMLLAIVAILVIIKIVYYFIRKNKKGV